MKNLILLIATISIFSCSKKEDPQPSTAKTTTTVSANKKVYYKFEALVGSYNNTYFGGIVDVNGKKVFSAKTPIKKYVTSASHVYYYLEVPGLDTSIVVSQVSTFRFTLGTGPSESTIKYDIPSKSYEKFLLSESDTAWIFNIGSGRQLK